MKLYIFIFILCVTRNAVGDGLIYLTDREQLSLRILSESLPKDKTFENYMVTIEDKKNIIEVIFFETDDHIDVQGGGGEMYVYHVNLKDKVCTLVQKTLMR